MKRIVASVAFVFMTGPLGGWGWANMMGPHLPQYDSSLISIGQAKNPLQTREIVNPLQSAPVSAKAPVAFVHTDPQLGSSQGWHPSIRNAIAPDGAALTFGWSIGRP